MFHGLHVLVGMARFARCWWSGRARGRLSPIALRLWTLYLHMVAVLWAIMFVAVYLL